MTTRISSIITHDVPSSLVVFLVALPLSMGIAIASGVPPALGLLTAMLGALIVGPLGGAPLQVSGPSAGMGVLVLQLVDAHGFRAFGLILAVAGVLQLVGGVLKIGRQFQAVSPAVIRGMLSGIGVLIILSQTHVMLDRAVPGTGLENLLGLPVAIWETVTDHHDLAHDEAAVLGVATLLVVILWERFKRGRLRYMPGPLVGVILAGIAASVLNLPIKYVAVPDDWSQVVTPFYWKDLALLANSDILLAACGLAFVASAESLLCASAVSRMHDYGSTNYDRELTVHGGANILCGLIGTLPVTGVISRSTANVEAGARTRWSATLHGVWIAGFVLFLPDLLALVPTSSLAAILIYVGVRLLNIEAVQRLARFGWAVLLLFLVTLVGVVATNLLQGIMAGLILSAVRLIWQMSHVHFQLVPGTQNDDAQERWDLHMHGSATFLALPHLQDVLDQVKPGTELHWHFDDLAFIDHASLDLLDAFRERHEAGGGKVVVEWEELFGRRQRTLPSKAGES